MFKQLILILPAVFALLLCASLHAETLPDAPIVSSQVQHAPVKQPFFASKLNRSLVASEFTVRILDAISTEQFVQDPCKCIHETGQFFGLSLKPVAAHAPLQYAYSLGTAGAYTFAADQLWNHGHKRIARGLLLFDVVYDAKVGPINNWHLIAKAR